MEPETQNSPSPMFQTLEDKVLLLNTILSTFTTAHEYPPETVHAECGKARSPPFESFQEDD
jgi:hypothetical protein